MLPLILVIVAGIARLMTESRHDGHHVPWVLPPGISQSQLGGVFKLDWLHKYVTLPYTVCLCDCCTRTCTCMLLGGGDHPDFSCSTSSIGICMVLLPCDRSIHMYYTNHTLFVFRNTFQYY